MLPLHNRHGNTSHPWTSNSVSVHKYIPYYAWNLNFHYCVHSGTYSEPNKCHYILFLYTHINSSTSAQLCFCQQSTWKINFIISTGHMFQYYEVSSWSHDQQRQGQTAHYTMFFSLCILQVPLLFYSGLKWWKNDHKFDVHYFNLSKLHIHSFFLCT
jgi:hypothetical protein